MFMRHIGRGLLWRRAETTSLKKIVFDKRPPVPSWSWMAYVGAIGYMSPVGGSVLWDENISWILENDEITSTLKVVVRPCTILLNAPDNAVGIDMDNMSDKIFDQQLDCVVVGRVTVGDDQEEKKHWIVVVRETGTAKGMPTFERLGIGWVKGRFIGDDKREALLV